MHGAVFSFPTDDTDLHGISFCRPRIIRIIVIEKNIKEPLIGGCSTSNVICADIHL